MHEPKAVAAAAVQKEKEAATVAAKVQANADTPIGKGAGKTKGKGGKKETFASARPPSVQTGRPGKALTQDAVKMKSAPQTDASIKGDDEHKVHRGRDERHDSKQIGDQLKTKAKELHQMNEWEEHVNKWSQIRKQLREPKLSNERRIGLQGQIKVIDPQYNTGTPGGMYLVQRRRQGRSERSISI